MVAVAVATTLLLHRYISFKKTPLYVYIMTWIGWFMCFGIVVLVPVDILATKYRECTEITPPHECPNEPWTYVSNEFLTRFYQTFYFGTLLLTWLVYPFLGSFVLAGDFRITERIHRAIRENVYIYLGLGLVGFVIMIYLLAVKNLDWKSMVGLAMGAANAWGIVLVIVLMGYGLVETPRYFWNVANRQITLKHLQFKVADLSQQRKNAHDELLTTMKQIKKVREKTRKFDPYEKYLESIIEQCPPEYHDIQNGEGTGEITYATLVALNTRLKTAVQNQNRTESLYEQCVLEAFGLEDIISSSSNPGRTVQWSHKAPRTGRFANLINRFEWVWYNYLQIPTVIILALFFALQSLLLVWSEIAMAIPTMDLSPLSLLVKRTDIDRIDTQLVLFFPLGYAALVTYSTLFKIRIFNYYRLIPHQHSDPNSILFSAAYLCRLAAPLCFNFISFIKTATTFNAVMGGMDATPLLGNYFYVYFPIVITVVVLATTFNLYTRLMNCLNITRFRFDSDFSHENIDEGKMILTTEKRRRSLNQTLASDSTFASPMSPSRTTSTNNKKYSLLQSSLDNDFDDDDDLESGNIDFFGSSGGSSSKSSSSKSSGVGSSGSFSTKNTGSKSNNPSANPIDRFKNSLNGFPNIFGKK
ncbi:hypothetical protein SAMD00019534_047800 [Acytostelium subglobosum LB1]|uniref:hypothetical protein n=1 Tax=Acytostelium subglobosum LB1 TaxID=1410327 RepID=UPI0006447C86|nr:hypothetical protein SAMD00019534_047800 [Acytostelium subglobosum LB1]GAM21605.1 hypothetical protein SAMD00019534_047800 [Acytostelium subglobosum LB1]|eukprot:XP_012755724.1 hypothetical protein SAMD00019534_047800 [Acytostelium subglobosum LB1]